jgi:hypothetical protein
LHAGSRRELEQLAQSRRGFQGSACMASNIHNEAEPWQQPLSA